MAAGVWVLAPPRVRVIGSVFLAAVGAAVVAAGAVAVNAATADPPAWPAWLSGVPVAPVPTMVGLFVAGVVLAALGVVWETRPAPVSLDGLFAPVEAVVSPASLLRADQAAVPFRGEQRHQLVTDLAAWCRSEPRLAVRLVVGRGGQGKTRLGRELAADMSGHGWVAGVLDVDASEATVRGLSQLRRPLLLVVDYAESRGAQLNTVLAAAATARKHVRVLLLARGAGEWRKDMAAHHARLELLATCPVDELDPVETTSHGRAEAWRDAVTHLGRALKRVPGYGAADWTRISAALLADPPELAGDRYAPVLAVHMDALAALLRVGRPVTSPNGGPGSAEETLLRHEQRYWTATATAQGILLAPATLRAAVAAATIVGAADRTEAEAVTAHLPGLADARVDDRSRLATWLRGLYPGRVVGAVATRPARRTPRRRRLERR